MYQRFHLHHRRLRLIGGRRATDENYRYLDLEENVGAWEIAIRHGLHAKRLENYMDGQDYLKSNPCLIKFYSWRGRVISFRCQVAVNPWWIPMSVGSILRRTKMRRKNKKRTRTQNEQHSAKLADGFWLTDILSRLWNDFPRMEDPLRAPDRSRPCSSFIIRLIVKGFCESGRIYFQLLKGWLSIFSRSKKSWQLEEVKADDYADCHEVLG